MDIGTEPAAGVKHYYRAAAVMRSYSPAKTFGRLRDALDYARKATVAFRAAYAVWEVDGGRLRLVKSFRVENVRA